ncbi:MAG: hypothetical protein JNK58_00290 [Phycisphaerae bacterium]|nr:hypothetical protein [Phycisphaerae bacterium]
MKQVWVMVGLGVTFAAGAAVLLPSFSAPPEEPEAVESRAPLASRPAATSEAVPVVQNNFAPINTSNVPSMKRREGPLRAPEPSKTAEVRRPLIANPNTSASADAAALKDQPSKVAPVAAAPVSTTTGGRGATNRPPASHPSAGTAQANAQAQLEQRRRDLENARRERLQQAQRNQGGVSSPHQRAGTSAGPDSSGEGASNSPNGAPTIEQLIASNPWLADYAPGGRLANSGATRTPTTNTNGSTNSGNTGGTRGNTSGGTSGGSTGGSTGSTGGGGGGGTVTGGTGGTPPRANTASYKWLPIDNRACGSALAGYRTNDLYVRLDVASPVLGLSTETNPLTIVGGSFYQASGTGDGLPTAAALATGPCVQFDTYFNSGSAFSLIGGTTENPVFTTTRVNGSLFNFAGVVGVQDPERFGDSGYYVLLGRFSAPTTITDFSGKISVDTGVPGTTSFRSFVVDVTFDSSVWAFNASFGLPGATTGAGSPPGAFTLQSPVGDATNVEFLPTFTWTAAAQATGYLLTVDDNADFSSPAVFQLTGGTTFTMALPALAADTLYYWRVVANNAQGTTASSPASRSFRTALAVQADPCANQAAGITAVWRPIDNMACAEPDEEIDLANFATADLYLRMATTNSQSTIAPYSLQFVSAEVTGSPPLRLTNGSFFEHSVGSNTRPSAAQVPSFPCLAFDSYVAIDTGVTEAPAANAPTFQPAPQLILPPGVIAFSPIGIRGLWVVPGFGATSALPAAKDPVRFPNDPCGYYVRIGRITITRGATFTGTLLVAFVLPGTGTTTTAEVTVPNCATCWAPRSQ